MGPYTQAADALETIINACYAPEGWTLIHDNLHPAVGADGTRLGLSPEDETARSGNMLQNDIAITFKLYKRYDLEIDPLKKIDPRPITELAERFRVALRNAHVAGTGAMWYFNLLRIRYPNDPTGNKTRFEADLVAYGNNSALVETTG